MAGIAATVAADLAAPDGHEWTRAAVGAAPGQDVAVGGLHDGEHMPRALVGHFCLSCSADVLRRWPAG